MEKVRGIIFYFLFYFSISDGNNLQIKFQINKTITFHFAIGIIVLNFIIVQHIIGFIMKKAIESNELNFISSKLPQIKKAHKNIGYALYLLTKIAVLSGIWIYDYIELL